MRASNTRQILVRRHSQQLLSHVASTHVHVVKSRVPCSFVLHGRCLYNRVVGWVEQHRCLWAQRNPVQLPGSEFIVEQGMVAHASSKFRDGAVVVPFEWLCLDYTRLLCSGALHSPVRLVKATTVQAASHAVSVRGHVNRHTTRGCLCQCWRECSLCASSLH